MMKHFKAIFASIALFAIWTAAIGAEQNVQVLYTAEQCSTYWATNGAENISAGYPITINAMTPYPVGKPWIKSYEDGNYSGLTAQPPLNDYHNILEWYHQRYTSLRDDLQSNRYNQRDWSAYHYLRADVQSTVSDVVLGILVKDASGPRINAQYTGLYTPVARFHMTAGQWQTINFPLKALADIGELDLTRITGFILRYDGYLGDTQIRIENIRLVESGDPAYPLVEMEGAAKAFGRRVVKGTNIVRDGSKLVRNLAPVSSAVGPSTVVNVGGAYACATGHFGGSGATYYQHLRRGVVAYDNDRLFVLFKTSGLASVVKSPDANTCEGGGITAYGSFDGGQTWGGITRGETRPTLFTHWYWRSLASADYLYGDVYFTGVQNCGSYHSPVDVFFRRLAFNGDGWVEDRFAIMGQVLKCPPWSAATMLPNGRLWANVCDGWGGDLGKYSDDDGLAWVPCKNSTLSGSTQNPRPFYQPGVDPVPDSVLVYPGEIILGSVFLPYANGVANFSYAGDKWKVHNGVSWGSDQAIPSWGSFNTSGYSEVTGTAIENDHLFLCKGGKYSNTTIASATDLVVTNLTSGGSWQTDVLESGQVTESILTSSGNVVFCFYVTGNNTVKYRKWKDGVWEAAVTVGTETDTINRLAAPVFCPPTYAAVFWDQYGGSSSRATYVKFAKIPADNDLLMATAMLPAGTVDVAYTASVQAACGTTPYTLAVVSGNLPTGLVMSNSGIISGTPTAAGISTFRVRVTDANTDTASREVTLKISAAGSTKTELSMPALSANLRSRPNPFTASTAIEYELVHSAQVALSIYDRTGRLVKRFAEGTRPAGIHRVDWKPVQQAAGIYYVRLKAGDYAATKMMVRVK
ncbi:MAG: putative Ig domain-containing protein [Fibrobacterota bacterium]